MKSAGLFGPGAVSPLAPVPAGPAAPRRPGESIPGVGPAGEALVRGRPVSGKLLSGASPAQKQRFDQFAGGIKPAYALKILAGMLQIYAEERLNEATAIAKASQERASKIAALNEAWFEAKAELQKTSNPAKPDELNVKLDVKFGPGSVLGKLHEALLGVSEANINSKAEFIDYLFPGRLDQGSLGTWIRYSDLQTAGAVIANNCTKAQVSVERTNNEFKNIMMMMNAAKEEYKALNKEIIALTKM